MVKAFLALLLPWVAATAIAQDVDVRASVDRASPRVNESFTYVLRAQGRVRGEPDISPVEELFDVLQSTKSTRVQIIDGEAEQVAEWIYQLMPREAGDVLIPPVEVADTLSNAVELEVLPETASGDAPADVFVEVDAQPTAAYVQSQVIYTLRLFVGVNTGRRSVAAPPIEDGEAIVERLGEDRQYQATRGGREFLVFERRYAIFPQEAGTLRIGPAVFEAMVIPGRGFSRMQRFRSERVEIEVMPAVPPPAAFGDAAWLPARSLELDERWTDDPPELAVGVPTTRAMTIEAEGVLESQLPELDVGQGGGVRQYADQPELGRRSTADGLVATRTERYAVLPQSAGETEVPGIELPWFDVGEGRWRVATIAPRPVNVAGGALAAPTPLQPLNTSPSAASEPGGASPVREDGGSYWPALAAVLAAGWIATLLLWWRDERAAASPRSSTAKRARPTNRRLLRRLRSACDRGDAHGARDVLLEWAALRFPKSPPRSLGSLADRLPERPAGAVLELEAALYGPGDGGWDGSELKAGLAELDSVDRRGKRAGADEVLLPLYR